MHRNSKLSFKWAERSRQLLMSALFVAIGGIFGVTGSALAQAQDEFAGLANELEALPDISMFAEAFNTFDVASMLDPEQTYTIFAPTDASLQEAEFEFTSAEDVMAHIVPDTFGKAELAQMAQEAAAEEVRVLESLAGTEIELALAQQGEVGLNGDTYIMLEDTETSAVAVHTVDGLLIDQNIAGGGEGAENSGAAEAEGAENSGAAEDSDN